LTASFQFLSISSELVSSSNELDPPPTFELILSSPARSINSCDDEEEDSLSCS
jgi:hypothetical protein